MYGFNINFFMFFMCPRPSAVTVVVVVSGAALRSALVALVVALVVAARVAAVTGSAESASETAAVVVDTNTSSTSVAGTSEPAIRVFMARR